jgi:type I restriction enzyme, S subunit
MSLVVPFEEIFQNKNDLLANHASWERVELGDVCSILNGYALKSSLFNSRTGFPVIRIRDLAKNTTNTLYDGMFPEEYIIQNGDMLIGMDGIFRCYEWSGGAAVLNQRVCKITSDDRFLLRKFLLYGINGYLKAIEDATSSVTVGHLSSKDILRIPFPLPPLAEQRRIVAKLESLLGKVEACQQRLAKIPVILKRFRQAVLAAACSGELTVDWRTGHPILEFRSSDGTDANGTQEAIELPTTWSIILFRQLIESSFYGPRFSAESYTDTGIPTIRTTDISFDGSITLVDAPRLSVSSKELEKYGLQQDDLLVTRTGATIGKCALYDSAIGPAIPSAYLIRFRLHRELIFPKYALTFFMSPKGQQLLLGGSTSVAQPNVNAATISDFLIPTPPYEEQQEIVRRVEAFFQLADQLESRYQRAKAQVDKLQQSILAKAFRGELVPTEAELARQEGRDYEPATVLLERIRRERAVQAKLPKKKPEPKSKQRKVAKTMALKDDVNPTHLRDLILASKHQQLTPKELWQQSGLVLDDFYSQLKEEVDKGFVDELRPNNTDRYLVSAQ